MSPIELHPEHDSEGPISFGITSSKPTRAELRSKVAQLEAVLLEMGEYHAEFPLRHYFAKGIYLREMTVPKGGTFVGKIHKTQHMNIISKGDISVLTENGMERLKAPYTLMSNPGTKRAGYAHEETVWTTIHVTDETDLEKLEADLVTLSYEELDDATKERLLIGGG